MATNKKDEKFNFEKSIDRLNELVEKMEHGELPLEQSLHYFEEGIELIRRCQKVLTDAEQKVQILMQEQGKESLKFYVKNEVEE